MATSRTEDINTDQCHAARLKKQKQKTNERYGGDGGVSGRRSHHQKMNQSQYLALEGLTWRPVTSNDSPVEEDTHETHICQTHCESQSPSGCIDICHHSHPSYPPYHPPPQTHQTPSHCPGVRGQDERWRYDCLTRGGKEFYLFVQHFSKQTYNWRYEICGFFFLMTIQTYISWLLPGFTEGTYGSVFCMQHRIMCANAKSVAERALCHWMTQHVVYWSRCWSNNRAIPPESQRASLAAAISALVPLLITSVDHPGAIS